MYKRSSNVRRKARELNPAMREGIARKQARYMQMFGDDDWKKVDRLIQDQGNDYYRTDLFPDRPTMVQAIDDFETYRTGTPAMEQVADDMRRYYGLTAPAPAVVSRPAPANGSMQGPAQAFAAKKVAEVKQKMFGPELPPARVQDDQVMQQQIAAAEQQVQNINKMIIDAENELKPKGMLIDDPYLETAILAAAALGTGGVLGRATAPEEEEQPSYLR